MRHLMLLLVTACAARTQAAAPIVHGAPAHATASAPSAHAEAAHEGHHFTDPEAYVADWNDPSRDAWQKPGEIIVAAEVDPGDTVVDLGAGTGYLLPALARAVGADGSVIALDVEPSMVSFLREAIAQAGWSQARAQLAAPDDPGLPHAAAAAVVALNVWHHVDARPAYAAKVLQALEPGGVFVVVDFLPEPTEGGGPPLTMRLSAAQVVDELTAAGFEAQVYEETLPRHYIVRGRRPTTP